MPKFRKKPVVIEAVQWTGHNMEEIDIFKGITHIGKDNHLMIPTLEGPIYAAVNDWIIKGVKGEFYPCKPDIFEQTYDEVLEG